MNWLDVGIWRRHTLLQCLKYSKRFKRFGLKLVDDFSYLMIMTDGIYDLKFVETNLKNR
jgi:hypothetical protein